MDRPVLFNRTLVLFFAILSNLSRVVKRSRKPAPVLDSIIARISESMIAAQSPENKSARPRCLSGSRELQRSKVRVRERTKVIGLRTAARAA